MPAKRKFDDDEKVEKAYLERKVRYMAKLNKMFDTYSHILICNVDNVGSSQMQAIRLQLRGKGHLVLGKNTMVRKLIRDRSENDEKLKPLGEYIRGNIGLIFTDADLGQIRKMVEDNKVPAAARVGAFAPSDVHIPAGPTGLDPGQTNFFQTLQIATKIVKSTIEILNDVHLVSKGNRVSASAVALLGKLNIRPFFFSMMVESVYDDGCVYGVDVLDTTQDVLLAKFFKGVRQVAALSLGAGVPTLASLPHSLARAYKKILALAVVTEGINFVGVDKYKAFLADPAAYAAAHGISAAPAAAAAAAPAAAASKAAPAKKAPEPEPEEEEDGGGGFSLFD